MFVRVVLPLLLLGLLVFAVADCASSEEEDRAGVPRWLWLVLIVFLPLVGPVAWIVVRTSQRAARGGGAGRRAGGPSRPGPRPGGAGRTRRPSGPVAPDDDPEFLWRLEQEKRRREREQGDGPASDDGAPGGANGSPTTGDGPTA